MLWRPAGRWKTHVISLDRRFKTGDNKNINLSLFYYKMFSWLKIEFYENDFIGYILGKEREGRTEERERNKFTTQEP